MLLGNYGMGSINVIELNWNKKISIKYAHNIIVLSLLFSKTALIMCNFANLKSTFPRFFCSISNKTVYWNVYAGHLKCISLCLAWFNLMDCCWFHCLWLTGFLSRALRERWERFTDDLNEAEQNSNLLLVKLLTLEEGCQQFSQWMDGVKKTIAGYCLQATINDKKTQLQHFKVTDNR